MKKDRIYQISIAILAVLLLAMSIGSIVAISQIQKENNELKDLDIAVIDLGENSTDDQVNVDLEEKDPVNFPGDIFENEKIRVEIPNDWKLVDTYSNGKSVVIEKGDYFIKISTDVTITGGGWGYTYDTICINNHKWENTLLEGTQYERVDEIMTLESTNEYPEAGSCDRESLGINDTQESPYWAGSMIKVNGSEYPVIERGELFDTEYEHQERFIIVKYGYKYDQTYSWIDVEFPAKEDPELLEMLGEMDDIVDGIEFYE